MKGIDMSIDATNNVKFSAVESQSENKQTNTTLSFRKNDYERIPQADAFQSDEKKGKGKKVAIGLGGVAALATLAVLGRNGRLGEGIKKFLGGAKKAEKEVANSDIKKSFKEVYDDAIKNKKESVKNEITGKMHEFKYDENGKLTEEIVKYTDKDGNNIAVKYQRVNDTKNNEVVEQMKIVEIKNGDNVVSQRGIDKDGSLIHKNSVKTDPAPKTVTEEVSTKTNALTLNENREIVKLLNKNINELSEQELDIILKKYLKNEDNPIAKELVTYVQKEIAPNVDESLKARDVVRLAKDLDQLMEQLTGLRLPEILKKEHILKTKISDLRSDEVIDIMEHISKKQNNEDLSSILELIKRLPGGDRTIGQTFKDNPEFMSLIPQDSPIKLDKSIVDNLKENLKKIVSNEKDGLDPTLSYLTKSQLPS